MNRENRFLTGPRVSALAVIAMAMAVAPAAHAGNCADLENPVYVTGSSAVGLALGAVAGQLRQLTPPINIVYQSSGSCSGGVAVMTMAAGTIKAGTTPATIYGNDGKPIAGGCDLDSITGNVVDIGVSDVYADTCKLTPTSDVKDFHGFNQVMTFAVPTASTATAISAEAAYLVYGFGAASHAVAPWTDPAFIFQRNSGSGTQNMIATAIKVPAAKWLNDPAKNTNAATGDMFNSLAMAGDPTKAIGILATDFTDANDNRSKLKILPYQHYGQECGYLPDSKSNTFDKANVRDGHYMIWGPLHMLVHTTGGNAVNPNAQKVLDILSGANADPGFDLIQVEAKAHVVPDCAMRVSRDTEVGPLSSYQPKQSCECKFVAEATGTAPSGCKTCSDANPCTGSATHCNFGYCEVK
jgi:ABC-type phosphate transport system substrate-binding protein